jgi:pimeloyl-ACP methyl ester carboxylesterase
MKTSYLDTESKGPTIVLVHGFGASAEYWRALYPDLSKDYRVVGLDLLGYGYSEKPKDITMSI